MRWGEFESIIDKYFSINKKDIEHDYLFWSNNSVWGRYYTGGLSSSDVNEVVRFLKEWGRMDRVIGKIIKKMGEKNFIEGCISSGNECSKYFQILKEYKFPTIDFSKKISFKGEELKISEINERIFALLGKPLKWTSASKVMHLVNSEFFIMWDDNIRTAWGCNTDARSYTNFIQRMKIEYKELVNDFSLTITSNEPQQDLLLRLNKKVDQNLPLTRWLDVYNWTKYTKLKIKDY